MKLMVVGGNPAEGGKLCRAGELRLHNFKFRQVALAYKVSF